MKNPSLIESLFTAAEIESIKHSEIKERRHPLSQLLFPTSDTLSFTYFNTDFALKQIKTNDYWKWIESLKERLLDTEDYTNASATLGEIRAFGYMLGTGLKVTLPSLPKGKERPEFWINPESEKVIVEVHSKQMEATEAKALAEFKNTKVTPLSKPGVDVKIKTVVPFGRPAIDEKVTENVICKLAQIKEKEHQLSKTETSILWLDFQDEIWNLGLKEDSSLPIRTWSESYWTGELWHAFYGWKGAPIFEGEQFGKIVRMRHDGRFRKPTKVDAVIIALQNATMVIENPSSLKPIKSEIWRQLQLLHRFSLELSWINWPAPNLKERLSIAEDTIKALEKEIEEGL